MHANCSICNVMTRARAYRWLGENHWIPGLHGAHWLRGDLRTAVSGIGLGEEIEFDYRGEHADAPRIAVYRSVDDVFTAQGPDGWLDVPGHVRWTWPASGQADRLDEIVFSFMSFLKARRGAAGVILVGPN